MIAALSRFRQDVLASVKMPEVEETFDLVFSRPLGLIFARLGHKWGMTAMQMSVASMSVGVIGGAMLFFQFDTAVIIVACVLISLAGVLDSSDGQLARMRQESSDYGRLIDGVVDNVVFTACYLGGMFYVQFHTDWSFYIYPFVLLCGVSQSLKSSIYELYKTEYMGLVGGFMDHRMRTAADIDATFERPTRFRKFLFILYYDYTRKQEKAGFRSMERRKLFGDLATDPATQARFRQIYRELQMGPLRFWALISGNNFHRTLIMATALMARFDLFFLINIGTFALYFAAGVWQKRRDEQMMARCRAEGLLPA